MLVAYAFVSLSWQMSQQVLPLTGVHTVKMLQDSSFRGDRTYLIVELSDGSAAQVTVPELCLLTKGSVVSFSGKLKEPNFYSNPGVFHYKKFLLTHGVQRTGYVHSCQDIQVHQSSTSFFQKHRFSLLKTIQTGPYNNSGAMLALLLAEKSLSESHRSVLQKAGIVHLFTISGTHFAILCLICFFVVQSVLQLFPRLFLIIPKQKVAAAVTLVFSWGYAFCLSYQTSFIRAAVMVSFYLLSVILNRQNKSLLFLLWSAVLILMVNPLQVFQIGFQLSYLSVLFLLLFAKSMQAIPLSKSMFKRLLLRVLQFFLVSFSLQMVLAPVLLYYFGSVSFWGIVHNLWAIPVFQFVVLPLNLLIWFAELTGGFAVESLLFVFDHILSWFFAVSEKVVLTDWFIIEGFKPFLWQVVLFLGVVFWFVKFGSLKRSFILIFSLVCLFVLPIFMHLTDKHIQIKALDVGQGDALVLQQGAKAVLIDTGGSRFVPVAKRVLVPYLQAAWINKIEGVILSHGDFDHSGALFDLIKEYPIDWVVVSPDFVERYPDWIQKLESQKIQVRVKKAGQNLTVFEEAHFNFLWPYQNSCQVENDCSLVARLTYKDQSVLLTGDISKSVEDELVQTYGDKLQSQILKVAHHGSRTSSSLQFLKHVRPKEAWISVKRRSHFGHPHKSVLGHFKVSQIPVKRTDELGLIKSDY